MMILRLVRRFFWLFLGLFTGVWAAFRLKRLVRTVAPPALVHQASGAGRKTRAFADDVRHAMHAREGELREALGLDAPPETDKDHH
jgi:hypothetical protein